LDQETVLKQFEVLESKIEQLIEACKRRETENAELRQKNELLDNKLQELGVVQQQNNELKALIRSKVDSLMGRLSEFTER